MLARWASSWACAPSSSSVGQQGTQTGVQIVMEPATGREALGAGGDAVAADAWRVGAAGVAP